MNYNLAHLHKKGMSAVSGVTLILTQMLFPMVAHAIPIQPEKLGSLKVMTTNACPNNIVCNKAFNLIKTGGSANTLRWMRISFYDNATCNNEPEEDHTYLANPFVIPAKNNSRDFIFKTT